MSKLKQQISEYLKKTQYGKTLERLNKKKRPCRNDGVFIIRKKKRKRALVRTQFYFLYLTRKKKKQCRSTTYNSRFGRFLIDYFNHSESYILILRRCLHVDLHFFVS